MLKIKIQNVLHNMNFVVNLLLAYERIKIYLIITIIGLETSIVANLSKFIVSQLSIIDYRKVEEQGVC